MSHRFLPSPETATSAESAPVPDPGHTAAIKRWTHELLQLGDDEVVTVSEIACADAGCPLVETTVTVFSPGRTRAWAFTRPKVALTRLMVQQTLAAPPRRDARG
jgi:hypothetical protein